MKKGDDQLSSISASSSSSSSSFFRPALPIDCPVLSALALRSKGHWGYDDEFLEACRGELTITPDLLDRAVVRVLKVAGHVAGFYALVPDGGEGELQLEHFWLEPARIGQGLGREMWLDATRTASNLGCRRIVIHSDPYAEPFYIRMGAERVGEIASASVAGRTLPLLSYDI